eukprot:CAMPEP_0174728772 /NCGR_PEP_ID=MMETSP1094-20130205/52383_1 /TAXON_ID=156173 /ORGANISM="Chrysochromulina brevifilum, Strain UTEX LB 985" /LENGTH=59 /DNA_ID=CAMNT_0015930761 /DNA_START=292 /DNA_END=471 /DNA_ORIENTATION=+
MEQLRAAANRHQARSASTKIPAEAAMKSTLWRSSMEDRGIYTTYMQIILAARVHVGGSV